MDEKIICRQEITLMNNKYLIYLKEVPTRITSGGEAISTTVRAFIKKSENF